MSKFFLLIGLGMVVLCGLLFSFAPDLLSMVILGVMALLLLLGYLIGMRSLSRFIAGFHNARENIAGVLEVPSSSPWISVQQIEHFFQQSTLDKLFSEYITKVNGQSSDGAVVSDIEEIINEESLALRSWQGVVTQIPGTLTSLGLLGTFIGLVTGISAIGFSSVEATLTSIELLLGGIRTAFYTSIAGVVLSIFFNMTYKILWNVMVRELGLFVEDFHMHVLPSVEEQSRNVQYKQMQQVLERLDRIPKDKGFSLASGTTATPTQDPGSEQRMMPEIRSGLRDGEFVFFIQPRCDLTTRKIIGGEALVRWNHGDLGMISPAVFLPVVERNGFIVKIDQYIWEEVCKTIRRWVDSGIRPVPISINISKTDIMAMDVVEFFNEMVRKYRIPPRYLEIEIAQNAYMQSEMSVRETEAQLRQSGFRVIVDGFNSEFMSLSVMKQVEADAVKLDLRFLSNDKSRESQAIMAAVDSARRLQLSVTAEGIENAEQLSTLRHCGCTEGQGYHLYKPMSVSDFESAVGLG